MSEYFNNNKIDINSKNFIGSNSQNEIRELEEKTDTLITAGSSKLRKQRAKLYWFFGIVTGLAMISLVLSVLTLDPPKELPSSDLRQHLSYASDIAVERASDRSAQLIDAAYKPVYNRIPEYVDFHYSIIGSYVEMSAYFSDPEKLLEEKLFKGLEEELQQIPRKVSETYFEEFKKELEKKHEDPEFAGFQLGPLSKILIADAVKQTGTTAIVIDAALKTMGLANRMIAKVGNRLAKKMGAKGLRGLTAAKGTISGAAICAWAGPAATLCGAAGGIATWFGSEWLVNEAYKKYSSEDFAQELRAELDVIKASHKALIKARIEDIQSVSVQSVYPPLLQDFTLKQLSNSDLKRVCQKSTIMIDKYEQIRTDLFFRSENHISDLKKKARQGLEDIGLFEISEEILRNLNYFNNKVEVTPQFIFGFLPTNYDSKRPLSGTIEINGNEYFIEKSAPILSNFRSKIRSKNNNKIINLRDTESLRISANLEQHLLLRNRFFSGSINLERASIISNSYFSCDPLNETCSRLNNKFVSVPFIEKSGETVFGLKVEMRMDAETMNRLSLIPTCDG